MFFIPQLANIQVFTHTATDDLKFRLVQNDLWIRSANIHITSNNADYGDTNSQESELTVGDILTFEDFNLADLFFKNSAAGSNTVVTAICVLATKGYKKFLEVE